MKMRTVGMLSLFVIIFSAVMLGQHIGKNESVNVYMLMYCIYITLCSAIVGGIIWSTKEPQP
jgi:hypothetical protein